MIKQFKKNQKTIISFNKFEKVQIPKSELKAIKGGDDIIIEEMIQQ